jgi:4-amino-4-deoxy-L-arabinose transferase-like glycosyltransferase
LWDEWYGGNKYHQEPLYAYMLASLYALSGNGIYWMMLLQTLVGIFSGILLWLLARRFFDDTVALVAGLLYALCGIVLFQETLILRTSWSVFFALLTVWTLQSALDKRSKSAFLVCGLSIGLAFLLQSYVLLFFVAAAVLVFLQEKRFSQTFLRNIGLLSAGFLLVFLPLIIRNLSVGAPIFSSSSIGAITFVATNVSGTNAITRWQPEAARGAEIMGKTNGRFGAAAIESIKTHPSIGSYLHLIWSKFKTIINGTEWPNNENYYFYKETVPILSLTFLDFYWIVWLGGSGILFSLFYKKGNRTLYISILIQVAIMLGFYVLGRLRAPLAVLMLPFVAYCIVEILRFDKANVKESLGKIGVAAVCFFLLSFPFYKSKTNLLDPADFNVLYDLVYFERVKKHAESKQMDMAISIHQEFLDFQPTFVKEVKPNHLLQSSGEVEVMNYFANHHQIHSYLYEDAGNQNLAAREKSKFEVMKKVVENSRRKLAK